MYIDISNKIRGLNSNNNWCNTHDYNKQVSRKKQHTYTHIHNIVLCIQKQPNFIHVVKRRIGAVTQSYNIIALSV